VWHLHLHGIILHQNPLAYIPTKNGMTLEFRSSWGVCGVQQRLQILCDLAYITGLPSLSIFMSRITCSAHADIACCALEYRREKVLEDSSVLLGDSRGQRGDPSRRLYGKFAGILQVEIRQRVSGVHILLPSLFEGNSVVMLVVRYMAQAASSASL